MLLRIPQNRRVCVCGQRLKIDVLETENTVDREIVRDVLITDEGRTQLSCLCTR